MSSILLQQALNELLAKRPQTVEERAAIDAAIASIVRGMQGLPAAPQTVSPTPAIEQPAVVKDRALPSISPFFGLGLREAGPKHLSIVGKPQTAREIWLALDDAGYKTAHGDPVHAVNDAMRRRAKTHGDILLVGEGKWGRKEWYTEQQLEEIRKSMGGMGGRDRATHSEATKTGMIVARSRGAKPGQPKKLKPEDMKKIEDEIRSGRSVPLIARDFNVVPATIYNSFERGRLRELKAEGKKDSGSSHEQRGGVLRVVK